MFDADVNAGLQEISDIKESFESGNQFDPTQPNIWLPDDKIPGFRELV